MWLLALVLVLGQWLTAAHNLQHAAIDDDGNEPFCALCLHAHKLDHAAAPTVTTLTVATVWHAPAPQRQPGSSLAPHAVLPPACGPPDHPMSSITT
ncbi:hypothetical protein JN531_000795 [Flagellatimonas centrodinii]|uniref:hypothetical protein n=1 Tax=Flagellatimonas centrodinii TaxID=2806210 RepID=UPI001FEDA4CE|nr:hypothetical protein [Flagellatimonas centrodinii]ULQ46834.1 hypothetical protein JN531_000795 [Flagellatimonas centrodinii]